MKTTEENKKSNTDKLTKIFDLFTAREITNQNRQKPFDRSVWILEHEKSRRPKLKGECANKAATTWLML